MGLLIPGSWVRAPHRAVRFFFPSRTLGQHSFFFCCESFSRCYRYLQRRCHARRARIALYSERNAPKTLQLHSFLNQHKVYGDERKVMVGYVCNWATYVFFVGERVSLFHSNDSQNVDAWRAKKLAITFSESDINQASCLLVWHAEQ